jgi:polar amino acid transport system substrate-binding protein
LSGSALFSRSGALLRKLPVAKPSRFKTLKIINILLLLPAVFLVVSICHAAPEGLTFTPEEQDWLSRHQTITVGGDPASPPFEFVDSKGRYKGMSADYLAYFSRNLGIRFKIVTGENWAGLMSMARRKKIDLLPAIVSSANRRKFLAFTTPWITVPGVVISTRECNSLDDLKGRTVAVVDGSIWDDYLSSQAMDFSLVRVKDVQTALELTAMSGVSAMVANLASATAMIHQLGIGNLRVALRLDQKTNLSFGVRSDWPELVSILNKTLADMDPSVKEEIRHRWLKLDEIPVWRDSSVRRIVLFLLGGFILIIVFFIIWNRSLKREVKKRSDALEQAHRHLVRAAKMESVGQLAAGVAHEVKNPLTIISMGVELLGDNPNLDNTEQQILTDMGDAVERADKVIRGLLDYAHYSKLERRPADINEVIARALRLVDHEMKKHRIEVHTNLAELQTADFDFNRMQQVFINLFMNSAQAMENGGRLDIMSRMHHLSRNEAELSDHFHSGMKVIKVTVSDNGPGIERGDSEKIFDPFYTTKDIGQGTGLGLSESRNIMELHNGTLHLTNCESKGACAVLLFPLEKGEENEKKDPAR